MFRPTCSLLVDHKNNEKTYPQIYLIYKNEKAGDLISTHEFAFFCELFLYNKHLSGIKAYNDTKYSISKMLL